MKQFRLVTMNGYSNWVSYESFTIEEITEIVKPLIDNNIEYNIEYRVV